MDIGTCRSSGQDLLCMEDRTEAAEVETEAKMEAETEAKMEVEKAEMVSRSDSQAGQEEMVDRASGMRAVERVRRMGMERAKVGMPQSLQMR